MSVFVWERRASWRFARACWVLRLCCSRHPFRRTAHTRLHTSPHICTHAHSPAPVSPNRRSVFDAIDVDASETLDAAELRRYMEDVEERVSAAAAAAARPPSATSVPNVTEAAVAPDGVPLAVHQAFCRVLNEAGGLEEAFRR